MTVAEGGVDTRPGRDPLAGLLAQLWPPGETSRDLEVSAILDSARDPRVHDLVRRRLDALSLFEGDVHPRLARVAPYIVNLGRTSPFTRELLSLGWGRSWGVFVRSRAIVQDLRRHFRRLLVVRDERRKKLFFRIYDPRVLRVYLPTCTAAETEAVFGPIDSFVVEDEDSAAAIEFRRGGDGRLTTVRRPGLV
jgi:hypothetical protein